MMKSSPDVPLTAVLQCDADISSECGLMHIDTAHIPVASDRRCQSVRLSSKLRHVELCMCCSHHLMCRLLLDSYAMLPYRLSDAG